MASMTAGAADAGPIVAVIFVLCARSFIAPAAVSASRAPECDPARVPCARAEGALDAQELDACPERDRQLLPPVPVVLSEAVLDRHDGIAAEQLAIPADHFLRASCLPRGHVVAVLEELARGDVERERDVVPGSIASPLD